MEGYVVLTGVLLKLIKCSHNELKALKEPPRIVPVYTKDECAPADISKIQFDSSETLVEKFLLSQYDRVLLFWGTLCNRASLYDQGL